MSLPGLVGGGADCGPVNPLQQLGKRFGEDRGSQLDAQQGGAGAQRPGFRSQHGPAQDPAFFARQSPAEGRNAFHVGALRQALPAHAPAWNTAQRSTHAGPSHQAATPAWAQDFLGQRASGVPAPSAAVTPYASRHAMPMQPRMRPQWQNTQAVGYRPAAQPPVEASQSSWDSAFTAIDQQTRQEPIAAGIPSEAELGAMDADELAQTAARLLSSVEDNVSEKFQHSEFLQLMRRLRDRQAEVLGTSIVEHGASDKGKERAHAPPTQAELDAMLHEGAQAMHQRHQGQHMSAHAEPTEAWKDLHEFWADEDKAREAREKLASSHGFQGDGGDVAARMHEDAETARHTDPVAAEFTKWTSNGGHVPGARSAWEEDPAQAFADDQDFVGRAWHGQEGRGRMGAQEAEWARLQSDWDEFEAKEPGIFETRDKTHDPFPYEAPVYRFREQNPYASGVAGRHAPPVSHADDGVLEHEAAVQNDPSKAAAWYGLGLRQQENERETQAIAALHQALALEPRMKEAWLALAVSYTNENDMDAALESIERYIQTNDTYAEVVRNQPVRGKARHQRLAHTLMAMARSGVAGEGAIDADIQVALGVLFNSCSEYDKAVDCFRAALSARPDDWLLYNRIGATLSNSGRSQESLEYYHHALQLRPDFARCHFNLSISCLNMKMYQEAAEHAYTALTLQSASDTDGMQEAPRDLQNNSLWEILRVSLELMHRPDLAQKCELHDVDALQLEEIVGM